MLSSLKCCMSMHHDLTLHGCRRGEGEWKGSMVKLWIKTTTSKKFVTTYFVSVNMLKFNLEYIEENKQTARHNSKIQNTAFISVKFRSMISLSIQSLNITLSVFLLCPIREIISKFSKQRTFLSDSFTEYYTFLSILKAIS